MSGDVSLLQRQLDDVRAALRQARELIGPQVSEPPGGIETDPGAAGEWVV
ncbi:MAG: hypothetical protein AB7G47_19640 [Mycolicibacterium sp.]